MSKIDSIVLL